MNLSVNNIQSAMNTLQMSDCYFDKQKYKKIFIKVLRNFAKKELGLSSEEYRVTFNEGGQVSEGDAVLHTESFYISVCARTHMGAGHQVLYRKCNGMKDYTGGTNNWCDSDVFNEEKVKMFVNKLNAL